MYLLVKFSKGLLRSWKWRKESVDIAFAQLGIFVYWVAASALFSSVAFCETFMTGLVDSRARRKSEKETGGERGDQEEVKSLTLFLKYPVRLPAQTITRNGSQESDLCKLLSAQQDIIEIIEMLEIYIFRHLSHLGHPWGHQRYLINLWLFQSEYIMPI